METDELLIKKRFLELAKRAETTGRFAYTPFLGLAEQDILHRMRAELGGIPVEQYGGAEGCERVIVRFGSPEYFGYDEAYPIRLLLAEPVNQKFSDKLTHRDILGALMALGIERSATGDIILRENSAYIFVAERMSDYVKENFTGAKHTVLRCRYADELPEGELFRLAPAEATVASIRLDSIVAAFLKQSRADAQELIGKGFVFVNGRQVLSAAKTLAEDSVVSVRGSGRFIYRGELRETKKGRLAVRFDRYI